MNSVSQGKGTRGVGNEGGDFVGQITLARSSSNQSVLKVKQRAGSLGNLAVSSKLRSSSNMEK